MRGRIVSSRSHSSGRINDPYVIYNIKIKDTLVQNEWRMVFGFFRLDIKDILARFLEYIIMSDECARIQMLKPL